MTPSTPEPTSRWSTRSPGRRFKTSSQLGATGERARKHDHYLKGTVYCIGCGRRLILQHTRGKNGTIYEYFLCHRRDNDCAQRNALPGARVEERVADCYRTTSLTAEQRGRIEQVVLARLRRQQAASAERLDQLDEEATMIDANRGKLLDAYYANAIRRDLFLREQRRLKAEHARNDRDQKAARADLTDLEQQTREALDLLQDAHETYQQATEPVRKQINRAIFTRILLRYDLEQIRVELNKPYNALNEAND